MSGFVTRFAPSPTGPLHLGHAFSAMTAHDMAMRAGGTFRLRIEDLDEARSRPHWVAAIEHDLEWLGLDWPRPVLHQSRRGGVYRTVLERLARDGLVYPCSCSRADIRAALGAPQEGASSPDGPPYPGTCRGRAMDQRHPGDAIRIDVAKAFARLGLTQLSWTETEAGQRDVAARRVIGDIGDVVLARRLTGAATYHLAVVVDDAAEGITHVVRGRDLKPSTPIHVLLQRLLELPMPVYHHHRLIRDDAGKRLAKRDDARAIAAYRDEGATPADLRRLTGLPVP